MWHLCWQFYNKQLFVIDNFWSFFIEDLWEDVTLQNSLKIVCKTPMQRRLNNCQTSGWSHFKILAFVSDKQKQQMDLKLGLYEHMGQKFCQHVRYHHHTKLLFIPLIVFGFVKLLEPVADSIPNDCGMWFSIQRYDGEILETCGCWGKCHEWWMWCCCCGWKKFSHQWQCLSALWRIWGLCITIISWSSVNVSLSSSACNALISVCQLCEVLPDTVANVHYFWLK